MSIKLLNVYKSNIIYNYTFGPDLVWKNLIKNVKKT